MAKHYDIDDDTRELLEEVLQFAQRLVDLQYDDETADAMQTILEELADRFGIQQTEISVTTDEHGKITIDLHRPQTLPNTRANLTLVSDNGDVKPLKQDLPPGFSQEPDKPRSGPAPEKE